MVPWTRVAPASIPARETATPTPLSLWQWIPTRSPPNRLTTSEAIRATSGTSLPPFVSQRERFEAPPRAAASSVRRAYSGLSR